MGQFVHYLFDQGLGMEKGYRGESVTGSGGSELVFLGWGEWAGWPLGVGPQLCRAVGHRQALGAHAGLSSLLALFFLPFGLFPKLLLSHERLLKK